MLLDQLRLLLGAAHVLQGAEAARYGREWMGARTWTPLAVLRPANAAEVSAVLRLAHGAGTPVVPVAGHTGLVGGTEADGHLMLSLERLNRIREVRPAARLAIVEAGVVLSRLHDAVAGQGLRFPLTFGARGSAMIGGTLATNAGGSNVLRYGNARALCLGLEVVLADGTVLDLMSELHKDNSGYDLKDLFIGAEGTLGIITAAVLKLHPEPLAIATAMVAADQLDAALPLLNRLQAATGGAVEAFEYMPAGYIDRLLRVRTDLRPPFDKRYPVNLLVEIATTAPHDAHPDPDGTVPLTRRLQQTLEAMLEEGAISDAVIAMSQAQRREMWARREAAAELCLGLGPVVDNDIAVPVDKVAEFLRRIDQRMADLDPDAYSLTVAHLGDGNVHYSVWPTCDTAAHKDRIRATVEELVADLRGSFSAEHGIGRSKLVSMTRHKDPGALAVMRQIKAALDPNGILNPGKVLP